MFSKGFALALCWWPHMPFPYFTSGGLGALGSDFTNKLRGYWALKCSEYCWIFRVLTLFWPWLTEQYPRHFSSSSWELACSGQLACTLPWIARDLQSGGSFWIGMSPNSTEAVSWPSLKKNVWFNSTYCVWIAAIYSCSNAAQVQQLFGSCVLWIEL